jgi:hypothetical protein
LLDIRVPSTEVQLVEQLVQLIQNQQLVVPNEDGKT